MADEVNLPKPAGHPDLQPPSPANPESTAVPEKLLAGKYRNHVEAVFYQLVKGRDGYQRGSRKEDPHACPPKPEPAPKAEPSADAR